MWSLHDDNVRKGGEGVGACGRYLAKNAHRNSLITLLAKTGGAISLPNNETRPEARRSNLGWGLER